MSIELRKYSKSEIFLISQKSFVYGIYRTNRHIYIGKTNRGIKRLFEHRFIEENDIIYIWLSNDISSLEIKLIKEYLPIFNSRHVLHMSISQNHKIIKTYDNEYNSEKCSNIPKLRNHDLINQSE